MKKAVRSIAGIATLALLSTPVMAQTNELEKFTDVVNGSWYVSAIENAVKNDLLGGYPDKTIRPNGNITRAEIASVISKAFAATEIGYIGNYQDVAYTSWYYEAMQKVVNMGLFTGDNNFKLNPEAPITREEVAVVITKAFELESTGTNSLDKFVDSDLVSEWAKPYVSALVENKIMSGDNLGRLNPKGNITRAEFAQIMQNVAKSYVTEAGTLTESYNGTVVVRVPGVTMKDLTVNGDIVVADGVGDGEFTLDGVTVDGDVIVRGGGINSIVLKNKAKINGRFIFNNPNRRTRVASNDVTLPELIVKSSVILDADCTNVTVEEKATVEVRKDVKNMEINAADSKVIGSGKIEKATVNANDVEVNVVGTKVTVAEGVTGTTGNDSKIVAGTTETVKKPSAGGSGSGSSSSATTEDLSFVINDDGEYYSITGTGDFDNGFDGTKYYVEISGTAGIEASDTISSGAEAFTFVTEILEGLESTEVEKVMKSLDHKRDVDGEGFFTSKKYEDYRDLLEAAAVLMGDKHDNYDDLVAAEKEVVGENGENIETATFAALYKAFTDNGGSVSGLMSEINSVSSGVAELLGDLWGTEFIENLLK